MLMTLFRHPGAWFRSFLRAETANVTIIFALSLIPMLGLVGLAADYGMALSAKAKLDNAADAAAVAAVATAKAYVAANPTDLPLALGAVAAGKDRASRAFVVNAGRIPFGSVPTPTINLSYDVLKSTFTSKVDYSSATQNNFGKLFGQSSSPILGSVVASAGVPRYLDFYLLVDTSGSMGLPTSDAGQTQLAAVNPDNKSSYPTGCVFACHYSGNQGYTLAHQKGIALRVDSVAAAINNLLLTAKQTQTVQSQYRIGLYPFIVDAVQAAPLDNDFSKVTKVLATFSDQYLDPGVPNQNVDTDSTWIGSGGSHLDNIIKDVMKHKGVFGDGSTTYSPRPIIIIVTDGANNSQYYWGNGNWAGGSNPQEPTSMVTACQQARTANPTLTVAVLYTPYVPIQNPNASFAGNEDGKVNAIIPKLSDDLKSCATTGFFFPATTATDINNAMQTIFSQAVQAARLTN